MGYIGIIGYILGFDRNTGKESGNYHSILVGFQSLTFMKIESLKMRLAIKLSSTRAL